MGKEQDEGESSEARVRALREVKGRMGMVWLWFRFGID